MSVVSERIFSGRLVDLVAASLLAATNTVFQVRHHRAPSVQVGTANTQVNDSPAQGAARHLQLRASGGQQDVLRGQVRT